MHLQFLVFSWFRSVDVGGASGTDHITILHVTHMKQITNIKCLCEESAEKEGVEGRILTQHPKTER